MMMMKKKSGQKSKSKKTADFFEEVKVFLEEFGICLLNASDVRYRGFIGKIVNETGKGYKRLRIAKKDI